MQAADKSGEGKRRYPSTLKAFSTIYRKEGGLAGLYRGVGPTTQRAAILTATQLTSYDQGKHWIIKKGWVKEGLSAHFLASMFAGFSFLRSFYGEFIEHRINGGTYNFSC